MILDDEKPAAPLTRDAAQPTLDDLFRRAGVQHSDVVALVDPPNRAQITGSAPRSLTYGEADRIVSAIAGRLRGLGLPTDTIVAYQLPNTVESILTLIGILRAGMIAAPLPALWRKADMTAALARVGAKVLITTQTIGDHASADTAMQVAADLFPIRHLCAYGSNLADGILPLDDLLSETSPAIAQMIERQGHAADHVAVITWEITARGPAPVARSHAALIAAGELIAMESAFEAGATILSPTPPTSFAGIAVTVMPWLLSGGTLVLHHGFDPQIFESQRDAHRCDTLVVPATLLEPLTGAGFFESSIIRNCLALWRSPDRLSTARAWQQKASLTDITAFGEIGLYAAQREPGAAPARLLAGSYGAMPSRANPAITLTRSEDGYLVLRGQMVPAHDFPPGPPEETLPHLVRLAGGAVNTGYRCRLDPIDGSLTISAPPSGIVSIGGYRLARQEVETIAGLFGSDVTLAVLPNGLTGERLAGSASEVGVVRSLLAEQGVHALLTGAFRAENPAEAA